MAVKINGTEIIDDSLNVTTSVGTVDGRDVASDGTKLDTIDTNSDVTATALPAALTGLTTFTEAIGADIIPVYDASTSGWKKSTITNAALQGVKGQKGEIGEKGQKGTTGETGGGGDKGQKGEVGQTGGTGGAGGAGAKGQKGEVGNAGGVGGVGAKGQKGEIGAKGQTGDQGQKGQKGEVGGTGGAGAKGQKGEIGGTGGAGAKGSTGGAGGAGAKGQKGEVGGNGGTGAKGQKGEVGQKGQTGNTGGTGGSGGTGAKGQKGEVGGTGGTGGAGAKGSTGSTGGFSTNSNAQVNSLGVGTAASGTTGEIRSTNNVTAYYSDERLKDFHGTIPDALTKVSMINGYYFTENAMAKSFGFTGDRMQVGVSAQEVQSILPEVITEAPFNDEYLTVWYDKLVPLLIEAIKELKAEVEELKNGSTN